MKGKANLRATSDLLHYLSTRLAAAKTNGQERTCQPIKDGGRAGSFDAPTLAGTLVGGEVHFSL